MARKYFASNNSNYTQKLADYAVELKYENIPEEVIERAKMFTLHTLGVSLAAKPIDLTAAAIKVAKAANGGNGGEASVWVGGDKLSAASAAFANGTIADMLDWEDCAWTGHPSAGVIPVAAAVAESLKKTGKEYLEAVVAAYEVYQRVAMAVQPPEDFDHNKGWALGNWQIFATATPAAKLMGLNKEEMNQAFGMGVLFAAMPSNLQQATMSNAYHYQHGIAAQNGVLAAQCAKEGIDNLLDCFDIPHAYCEQLTTVTDRTWLDRRLNDRFYMMDILVKHWPANMWVNTPVEIVDLLVKENNIDADEIEEIVINPPTQYRMHFFEDGFETLMEAQFSMPYVIGALLADPAPGPNWYRKENFRDPKIMEYARRVKAGKDPEDTLLQSFHTYQNGSHPEKTVTITMKDKTVYSKTQRTHKGHPLDMLSREEFCDLFRREASFALTPQQTEKVIDFVLNIEKAEDMSAIHELLV
ncbi:MmgE/PrpD family protein [Hespellia stercorisuis]|uniref:2-methylcitrate dehydratase PrpD n=1 Tax=Hespellia stercorisuis DSM 15480 TaxID=1121950 RepID=A0A1M6M8S4_9FIRM|nr:MmgE/PrpD family protein [Hespellia stercorisuis]SHJ79770.1 2-methylcitrate dehydratase PrpD [Hespellia stercorisuis DSM 15480]